YDVRKVIYEKAKTTSMADVHKFFDEHVKGKKYNYVVIGKKEDLNLNALKEIGPVQVVELKDLFGY
ncbi:MAG TPA: hypothetical protein VK174_18255, partial [Chitinophagales bacterium]|nr:hypothetical protein [Chitinophagales bacterium]